MANQEINTLKPFIFHSSEMDSINPMFAFYLKTYAIEKGTAMYKKFQVEGKKMMFKFYRAAYSNGFRRPIR